YGAVNRTRAPRADSGPDRPARSVGPDRASRPEWDARPSWDAGRDAEAQRLEADTWVSARSTKHVPEADGARPARVGADNGFATLGLPTLIVERLAREGITTPFPIQAATIPDALAGRDVLGRGQTGSGKTLAFGLPTLVRLADEGVRPAPRRPRALILVPTRELAMQVSDSLEPLAHVLGLRHKLVAGGLSYTTQISALNRGVDLLIATPGRLIDLIEREAVNLGDVRIAILDEADHMADMGFMPEVTTIMDTIPAGGQRLLFSATLDKGVDEIVARYLTDPVTHSTDDVTASVTTMEHYVLLIDPQHKKALTAEVANRLGRTLVFVRTKLGADRVAMQLREQGVLAAALHGGLNQGARNRVLGAFRTGTLPVLVATDVAARGIHVDDVAVVLQADPPQDHRDVVDVDTARGDIGGDEDGERAGAEGPEDAVARALVEAAVQRGRQDALLAQLHRDPVGAELGADEDNRPTEPVGDLGGKGLLVLRVDEQDVVLHRGHRGGDVVGRVGHRVGQVARDDLVDALVQRCREEQPLTTGGDLVHDRRNLGHEAHVSHMVGLVEDGDAHVPEVDSLALDEVDGPTGRRDEQVDPAVQCRDLGRV
ncbi:MAG TPA: DEAD/DEAH box helicase, partial [Candidatus Lustribacter sp.]|nr:DEAD/DEAH box helicase [Candidatus Lustribacter sp.]